MEISGAFAEVVEVVDLGFVGAEDEEGAVVEALRGLVEVERGNVPLGIIDRVLVLAIEAVGTLEPLIEPRPRVRLALRGCALLWICEVALGRVVDRNPLVLDVAEEVKARRRDLPRRRRGRSCRTG